MSTFLLAAIGAKALLLTYIWLASAIGSSYLSDRKGYGEKRGLTTGLLTTFFGLIIWIFIPAKADSRWKLQGPFGSKGKTVAEARAEQSATKRNDSV